MPANLPSENMPSEQAADESQTGRVATADELLPPVEPPDAGFILQLFVVPAVIVLFVVMVWLLFGWLASSGEENAGDILKALRGSNHAQWQKANELASMLQMGKLKENTELASGLAQLLDEYVEARLTDDNSIKMRCYLCRVLGELHVNDGLAMLLKTARSDRERDVRREAIKALAVLGDSLASMEPPREFDQVALRETLLQLASDEDELIRSETAFAIGAILRDSKDQLNSVNDPLMLELEKLVEQLHADTRYNAALALARLGSLNAIDAIVEMLDMEAISISTSGEQDPRQQAYKRHIILHNALNGAVALQEHHRQLDLPSLREAVQKFLDAAPIAIESKIVRKKLTSQAESTLEVLSR